MDIHHREGVPALFPFSSLMTRTGQQFSVLVLAHLFSSFFDHAAQPITPYLLMMTVTQTLFLIPSPIACPYFFLRVYR
jgi:hypothetical protein